MLGRFSNNSRYKCLRIYYDDTSKIKTYVKKVFSLNDVVSYEEYLIDGEILGLLIITIDESFILNITFDKFDDDFNKFFDAKMFSVINKN